MLTVPGVMEVRISVLGCDTRVVTNSPRIAGRIEDKKKNNLAALSELNCGITGLCAEIRSGGLEHQNDRKERMKELAR